MRWCLGSGFVILLLAVPAVGDDAASAWPSWRGPSGQGYSDDPRVPLRWSEKENLLWKTPLPGRGNSTPIVWGGASSSLRQARDDNGKLDLTAVPLP